MAAAVEPLEARRHLALTATGIDPANMGKGDFIWQVPTAMKNVGAKTVLGLAQTMKSAGFRWVIFKAGDGDNGPLLNYGDGKGSPTVGSWTQFNRELIDTFHAQGIKVFGYQFVYGGGSTTGRGSSSIPAIEKKVALDILSLGADGLVIDAEGQIEAVPNNSAIAEDYCQAVRAKYPNTFMALSSFPYISLHTKIPWEAYSKYVDVHMPQDYWVTITRANNSPGKMISDMNTEWKKLYDGFRAKGHPEWARPIVPTGQGYNTATERTTTSMINSWYRGLIDDASGTSPGGYQGTSFWSLQAHTPDIWKGIVNNDIGNPGGIVTGHVFNDLNGDGGQARGQESGALGWTVYEDANKNSQMDANEVRTVTDTKGIFQLFWLPAGDHMIRQLAPSSAYRQTTQDSFTVTVLENETSLAGSFGVTQNPLIRGNIYNDGNVNGVRDASEQGIKGVRVWIDYDKDGVLDKKEPWTKTNGNGSYSFTTSLGIHQIRHLPLAGFRGLAPNRGYRKVTVAARGASYTGFNFGDTNRVLIKGVVFNDKNRNAIRDSGESVRESTQIFVDANANGVFDTGEVNTSTDASGFYRFNVAAGTFRVVATIAKATFTRPAGGFYLFTLKSGQTETHKDFGYIVA